MRRLINVKQLSPRRAFAIGRLHAKRQGQKKLQAMAEAYDSELANLQHEFHEIAVSLHRERYDRALEEAIGERAARGDALLLH